MTIFNFFTLLGGLAFFLYGMHVLSSGLEKLAGGKLEKLLKRMTANPFASLALGAGITIAIQSSSALTVMLVGLVNSGIMTLRQTIGVIMGSNIGTTLTAWLLSLTGIESQNFFISMLKPKNFSPLIALVGVLMIMGSKNTRKRDVGSIMIGFAILMSGMTLMSDAMAPLADSPKFAEMMIAFTNPLLGVAVGAIVTGVIQSSAASVGILQALALSGSVTGRMAFPIIMGQNIGTCVTAIISSFGVNRNAKRVSVVHMTFNLVGTTFFLVLYFIANKLFGLAFLDANIDAFGIALFHTIFNVTTTFMLMPFAGWLEKVACKVIKDSSQSGSNDFELLDERLLNTPSIAVSESGNKTVVMGEMAVKAVEDAMRMLYKFNEKEAATIIEEEHNIDLFEDTLGGFLVKLSTHRLTDKDSRRVSKLLHVLGDLERIGDHAQGLVENAREMHEKNIRFSDAAQKELAVVQRALSHIMKLTLDAYRNNDTEKATLVEPLEQVLDVLTENVRNMHIERLRRGECTIELGFILNDVINNMERISDHCSNVAICVLEAELGLEDAKEYLHTRQWPDGKNFNDRYEEYRAEYQL